MGFSDGILTFIGIASVPYFSPRIVSALGFGFFGGSIAGYIVPFMLNWALNFFSNYYNYSSNCKGEKTASMWGIWGSSIIGSMTNLIIGIVLTFIPFLKWPFLLFAIGGQSWIPETLINLLSNYNPIYLASTYLARSSLLKSSCKKSKKKD